MKKFIYIAIFFIFPNFFMGNNNYRLEEFESYLNSRQQFIENGVKLTYKTNMSEDEVIKTLKNKIDVELNYAIDEFATSLVFQDDDIQYSISIWSEDETEVAIQAINSNNKYNTEDVLKKIMLFNINGYSKNIYQYSKYKIIDEYTEYENILLDSAKNIQTIDIYNGKLVKVKLSDNKVISLAHMKYNSGNYLIIGTPMIFVTY